MVRQFIPLALAASLVATSAGAQEPARARTTVRSGPFGFAFANADGNRLVLGLTTSSGGMRDTLGLLVSAITPDSPAEKAGIEEGNRLTAINGVSLKLNASDASDPEMAGVLGRRLQRELDKAKPGEAVSLTVLANGVTRLVRVTPVRAEELRSTRGALRGRADERTSIGATLGGFPSPRDTLGVFVVSVAEDGPLAKAGIFEGSRIAAINGVDLRVPAADVGDEFMTSSRVRRLTREVEKLEAGANAELRVYSNGQYRNVTVKTMKRSELKGDAGISIFQSGGGTGVFIPPAIDMPGFRFDMHHDLSDDVRQRIEEALRGSEIQLRTLRDRLDDGSVNLRDLEERLRDHRGLLELEERLRDIPNRIRSSGAAEEAAPAAAQSAAPAKPATAPFGSAAMSSFDAASAVFLTTTPDAQPFFRLAAQPASVQAAQTGTVSQPRQGQTTYSRSGQPGAEGAVFIVAGIRMSPINTQLASYLGAGSERGLLVLEIDDHWSGLIAGDVLLSIGGRAVRERDKTFVFIDEKKDQPIEILRGGQTVKATLRRR